VDYAGAREAFFQPRPAGSAAAGTDDWDGPGRALRTAIEPIATICFWSEPASEVYGRIGLDFLTGYVWSRGCVLGEPEPTVVASAFAVFEPSVIAGLYEAARSAAPLAAVRAAREEAAVTSLTAVLGDPRGEVAGELERTTAALERGVAAIDTTGRPMSAGLAALPVPSDPWGRLWHATTRLREFRGDSHVAAYLAAGITGLEANLLTERRIGWEPFAYTGTRAWSPEVMGAAVEGLRERGLLEGDALSEQGRAVRDEVEAVTERQLAPVRDAIGGELPAVTATCSAWSERIVERGWFPPDPYKRAGG